MTRKRRRSLPESEWFFDCGHCGKQAGLTPQKRYARRAGSKLFCSRACHYAAMSAPTDRPCNQCGEHKPDDQFGYFMSGGKRRRRGHCIACQSIRYNKWRRENPQQAREAYRRWASRLPDALIRCRLKSGLPSTTPIPQALIVAKREYLKIKQILREKGTTL